MKATKLILLPLLLAGLAALSFAGPSPQFWDQQSRNQQAQKPAAATPAVKIAMICSNCGCACAPQ